MSLESPSGRHPHPNPHPNHIQDHDNVRHPTVRQMADFAHFQGNSDAMLSAEMAQSATYLPNPQQHQQPSHTLSPISPSHLARLDDWGAHPQFPNYHLTMSGTANRPSVPQGFLHVADDLVQVVQPSDPLSDGYDCFMTELGTTSVFPGEGLQLRTASNALCESIKSDVDGFSPTGGGCRQDYYRFGQDDEVMEHVTSGHAQNYYSVLQGQGIVGGQEMVGPYHAYLMNMGGMFYDDFSESTAVSPNNPRSTWLKFSQ